MHSILVGALLLVPIARADTLQDAINESLAAFEKGEKDKALKLADEVIKAHPKEAKAYLLRGTLREAMNQLDGAVADLSESLKLDPKQAGVFDKRGSAQFKLGRVKESAEDFDRFLALRPSEFAGHWRRGISLYYAGRYEDGCKQFEGYEKVDTNDVENAVWHYLCNVRIVGREKARAALLKIGNDKRVPMMLVYKLFKGEVKPDEILAAVEADKVTDEQRKQRRFYAHLYLGLWFESEGDKKAALEHLKQAATTYRIGHYMGDVAKVHADLLKK